MNGKGLSDTNFSQSEKEKLASLENYIPPSSQPIDFIDGLQDLLNQVQQNITLKVDKEDGKGLSDTNFSQAEKEKLAGLKQKWDNTDNSNIKTIDSTKVAINRDEADYALDVGVKTTETPLTGTASFNGFEIVGVGTSFLSELNNRDSVLLEDGQIIAIHSINNDTSAYSFSGGNPANSGVLKKVIVDEKLFNLQDVLQILRKSANNIYNNSELNFIGNANINRHADQGIIKDTVKTDTNGNPYIVEYIQGMVFGSIQRIYKDTNDNSKFRTLFSRDNGTYNLTIECNGIKTLKIWEDGAIEIIGLPTTSQGSNKLYRDTNGFLKIG